VVKLENRLPMLELLSFWVTQDLTLEAVGQVIYIYKNVASTVTSRCPYRAFGRHLRVQ
jgi:hypothetical protein